MSNATNDRLLHASASAKAKILKATVTREVVFEITKQIQKKKQQDKPREEILLVIINCLLEALVDFGMNSPGKSGNCARVLKRRKKERITTMRKTKERKEKESKDGTRRKPKSLSEEFPKRSPSDCTDLWL
jgi:hypothetical protein